MDFRSQLSALANNSGSNRGRSPNQGNNNNNYYGRGGGGGGGGHYNSSSGRYNDRRRPRGWDHQGRHGGPPNSRRRHLSPDRDGLSDLRDFGYRIPCRRMQTPANDTHFSDVNDSVPPKQKKITKHLALLAISIDDLPYEHIWKEWCQTSDEDVWISLICHAKHPQRVRSDWLRQRLLVYPPKLGRGNSFADPEFLTRTPSWGSVEITRAMLDLLEDGMRVGNCKCRDVRFSANRFLIRRPAASSDSVDGDGNMERNVDDIPEVDQFIYISETCLPVRTAQEVFAAIADSGVSWVNGRHRKGSPGTPKNKYESDQFGMIHRRIPGQYRWKADQWILLCRDHAAKVLNIDRPHIQVKHQLWNSFREINASDEMYFPTCLALLGLLRYTMSTPASDSSSLRKESDKSSAAVREVESKSGSGVESAATTGTSSSTNVSEETAIQKRPVTYTDWSEGMRNPATFTDGHKDFGRVAKLARSKGCLLARKFAPFVAVPGVKTEDQVVTGQITVDEWHEVVDALRERAVQDKPQPTEPTGADTAINEHGEAKEANGAEEQKQQEQESSSSGEEEAMDDGKEEERSKNEDEDQGEQELE